MQTLLPGAELVRAAGVREREHLLEVANLLEAVAGPGAAGDPLGRRVGAEQVRVLGLERAQLVEQRVVLVVADRRVVVLVVGAIVDGDLAAQLLGALACPRGSAHPGAPTSTAAASASVSHELRRSIPARSVRSKWIGVIAIRPRATAARSVPSSSSNDGSNP